MQNPDCLGYSDIKFNSLVNRVAVSTVDYHMHVYNMMQGTGLVEFCNISTDPADGIDNWKFDWHPHGTHLLSGCTKVNSIDIQSKERVRLGNQDFKFVYNIKYSPNSNFSAISTAEGHVYLYNMQKNELVKRFIDHGKVVRGLDFSKSTS